MTTTALNPDSASTTPEPTERLLDLDMLQTSRTAGNPLTLLQLRALLSLSDLGTQSVRGLADHLQVERSVVDGLCSPLITRGFLIRISHGSSDHSSAVVLSTAGQRFVAHLRYRSGAAFQRRRTSGPVRHPAPMEER